MLRRGVLETEQARSQDLDTHVTHVNDGRAVSHPCIHVDGRRQVHRRGVLGCGACRLGSRRTCARHENDPHQHHERDHESRGASHPIPPLGLRRSHPTSNRSRNYSNGCEVDLLFSIESWRTRVGAVFAEAKAGVETQDRRRIPREVRPLRTQMARHVLDDVACGETGAQGRRLPLLWRERSGEREELLLFRFGELPHQG